MAIVVGEIINNLVITGLSYINDNYQKYWNVVCNKCLTKNTIREDSIKIANICSNNLCNGKVEDLTGKIFGILKVVEFKYIKKNAHWVCECLKCGKQTRPISINGIKNKKRVSCGDPFCSGLADNLKDKIFGHLRVLRFSHIGANHSVYWICKCLLCNSETKPVKSGALKDGGTKSCGHCRKISENLVYKILKDIFIGENIIRGYRGFNWLRNPKTKCLLEIDFWIPQITMAIEFDGLQHQEPVCFGGISKEKADANFIEQKFRDKAKEDLILQHTNEIKYFIRIPYTRKIDRLSVVNCLGKITDFVMEDKDV